MSFLKVVWSSDWHLGLKTDDIDRTEEIVEIGKDVVKRAASYQEKGFETILVLGGDLFDSNNPSEKYIASLISVLNLVRKHKINTYVIVGNHEAIADPERLSCLNFLKEMKKGYPTVTLIEDIRFLNVCESDAGPVRFTFLPHITNALIHKKVIDGKLKKAIPTQEYINDKCDRIREKVGPESQHYVFSHLNVRGAHPGSEQNLLRKSEVFLPDAFTKEGSDGISLPTIIQGHIHSSSVERNINIIGSPIFCSFGEDNTDKYYAVINIPKTLGEQPNIVWVKTDYRPFLQCELDMLGEVKDFFQIDEVKDFLKEVDKFVKKKNYPVVKFDVTINPEANNYDWNDIKQKLSKEYKNVYFKQIVPRIIVKKQARSTKQKITLTPKEAVKVYINKNLKKTPKKAKLVYAMASKYLND